MNLRFSDYSFVISIYKSALNLENNNKNNLSKQLYNIVFSPKNELKSNDVIIPIEDKPIESNLEVKYNNQIVPNKDLTSLTYLTFKINNEYYQKMQDFQQDVTALFDNIYKNNTNREEMLPYLSSLYLDILKVLIDNENKFDSIFSDDINRLMENNTFPRCPESKALIYFRK